MATAVDVLAGRADWAVDVGDAVAWASRLPPASVHAVVTSPPYYGLRDYGVAGQIGAEPTLGEYVDRLVVLFAHLRRALHPSGTLWLNLGDSYVNGGGSGRQGSTGQRADRAFTAEGCPPRGGDLPAKNLLGVPWRVAFALQEDGWFLRQWMPWVKKNAMPESAADRPSTACETVFLLSREPDYHFDMEAVRRETRNFRSGDLWFDSVGMLLAEDGGVLGLDVPTAPFPGAHFAVFPPRLVEPMVRAGTSERGVCPSCGAPWVRQTERERVPTRPGHGSKVHDADSRAEVGNRDPERHVTVTRTVGWRPGCGCDAGQPVPAVVADPFAGSGTTLVVARDRGRRAVGCELNPEYAEMARSRVRGATPGFW
jgi:DNA modification methylase